MISFLFVPPLLSTNTNTYTKKKNTNTHFKWMNEWKRMKEKRDLSWSDLSWNKKNYIIKKNTYNPPKGWSLMDRVEKSAIGCARRVEAFVYCDWKSDKNLWCWRCRCQTHHCPRLGEKKEKYPRYTSFHLYYELVKLKRNYEC